MTQTQITEREVAASLLQAMASTGLMGPKRDVSEDEALAIVDAMRAERHRKWVQAQIRHEAKWANWLSKVTPKQSEKIEEQEKDGFKVNKLFSSRSSGLTAVMMVGPEKWRTEKQKICRQLKVVYPDGTMNSTWEKSITVEQF
jgi:hypothetical protein